MSKERRRRRAEREAAGQVAAARQAKRAARVARRKEALRPVAGPFERLARRVRPHRRRRPDSVLAPRRRRQNLALVAVLLALNVLLWAQVPDPGLRAGAAILSVIAWPVLVTVIFDRRSS